jgi:hypothetical protein
MTACSLAGGLPTFRRNFLSALKMEEIRSSETLVIAYSVTSHKTAIDTFTAVENCSL